MDLSNHSQVYLDLNLSNNETRTTWILNSNILGGKLKERIKQDILLYLFENDNREVSPVMVWNTGKAPFWEGKSIGPTKLDHLEKEFGKLERQHKKDTQLDITQKSSEIKNQIKEIYETEIQRKLTFFETEVLWSR